MIKKELFENDPFKMFDLLVHFPQQIQEALLLQPMLPLPDIAASLQQVVVVGMGGSAVGGELLAGLFRDQLDLPLIVNRSYTLPQFVGESTLVIACSYSGDTEETISAVEQADKVGAPVVCISSGGKLAKLSEKRGYGYIQVPGGLPPRCALGYMFFSLLTALQEYGLVAIDAEEMRETLTTLHALVDLYRDYDNPSNPAAALASALLNKIPIIYGADEPNAALPLRWRNQLNENAKVMAFSNVLPEMNHNEIIGWHPAGRFESFYVVLLCDDHNSPAMQRRMSITREIISNLNVPVSEIRAVGKSRLCRTFSLLMLADFVSFYLALLNGVDPTEISNIDHLKSELAKAAKKK